MTTVAARPIREHSGAPVRSRRHSFAARAKDTILLVAALLGLLGLVWLVVAPLLGLSVVVFKTGSMAPAMPAGSAAVVEVVAASELRVGDVVTVSRRAETLPVTHRIVSIGAGAASADRVLVLQGDANTTPDALPYTVTEVRRVVAALPGAGTILTLARSPLFLGAGTIVVAALVYWAFRPERGLHRA